MNKYKETTKSLTVNLPLDLYSDLKFYLINNNINSYSSYFNKCINDIYSGFRSEIDNKYITNVDNYVIKKNNINRLIETPMRISFRLNDIDYNTLVKIAIATNKSYSSVLRNIVTATVRDNTCIIDDFYLSNQKTLKELQDINKTNIGFNLQLNENNHIKAKQIKRFSRESIKDIVIRIIKEYRNNKDEEIFKLLINNNQLKNIDKCTYRNFIPFSADYKLFFYLRKVCLANKIKINQLINLILIDYFNNDNFLNKYYETNKK